MSPTAPSTRPVGPLLLAATAKGLVRVAYGCEDHAKVLERLARDLSPRILRAPARLDAAAKEIDEYFAGLRQRFDLPVDWSLARGFRRFVLTRLRAIGYGRTASYASIAVAAGNPKAVRAVGTACATNPFPSSCPAIAWCAATARSASTSAASTRRRPCSPWRRLRDWWGSGTLRRGSRKHSKHPRVMMESEGLA